MTRAYVVVEHARGFARPADRAKWNDSVPPGRKPLWMRVNDGDPVRVHSPIGIVHTMAEGTYLLSKYSRRSSSMAGRLLCRLKAALR